MLYFAHLFLFTVLTASAFAETPSVHLVESQSVEIEIVRTSLHTNEELPKIVTLNNTSDVCVVYSNEPARTEFYSGTLLSHSELKLAEILSVVFPSGCRLYFGRIKNSGADNSNFQLLGEAIIYNHSVRVTYSPFGHTPEEIIQQLLHQIQTSAWGNLDLLPIHLVAPST